MRLIGVICAGLGALALGYRELSNSPQDVHLSPLASAIALAAGLLLTTIAGRDR